MMPIVSIAMFAPCGKGRVDRANQMRKSTTVKIKSAAALIDAINAGLRQVSRGKPHAVLMDDDCHIAKLRRPSSVRGRSIAPAFVRFPLLVSPRAKPLTHRQVAPVARKPLPKVQHG
jgi:hypothetical protein